MRTALIFTAAFLIGFLGTAALHKAFAADGFTFFEGLQMEKREPDAKYRLETAGSNIRVYEWTPAGSPGTLCVTSFADAGPAGTSCFKKEPRPKS